MRRRWSEYFEQVLNVADVREAYINVVGNWRMLVLGDLNERAISLEEVGEAVNEMKSGMALLELLVRLLNLSFDMVVEPMDWHGACIVPLYKGKGDKCECSNSRGISL